MNIYSEYSGNTWRAIDLRLCFEAGYSDLYRDKAFATLTKKLGKLIESGCNGAKTASINGYIRGKEKIQITGWMFLSEGWNFHADRMLLF